MIEVVDISDCLIHFDDAIDLASVTCGLSRTSIYQNIEITSSIDGSLI